ncbi:MAG: ABC-F family ATP-binding cassette domain-containing protein, partial [Vallitaleaceae bacterium]|nr:ABC-F family ATP-binding cassette domain-containing protein [Vallitaleaceae bacterium]
MLLIEASNVSKYFGERLLFELKNFKVTTEDKIGIVGLNGSGKTTFIKMLVGEDLDYSGKIVCTPSYAYIPQLNLLEQETLSGGEVVKQKINEAFRQEVHLMLADEPTSNLDLDSVRYLENQMHNFEGGLLIISHDVQLLNKVCNKILEIELGKMTLYKGNYDDFLELKEKQRLNQSFEYDQYVKEKNRLENAAMEAQQRSSEFKRAPSRMGNSESRLHRRAAGERRAKVERTKVNLQARAEKLEVKDKPFVMKEVQIKVPNDLKLYTKNLIQGQQVEKSYGSKCLFKDSNFI